MFVYTLIEAVAAVTLCALIAAGTKKAAGVSYSRLDKAGRITNVLLTIVYVCLAPVYMFLGMVSVPAMEGLMWVLGGIIAIINASAALFCGLGIGFSVALRRKGRSKLSFAVQFAGVAGIALTVGMYYLFAGNLLQSLN